MPAAGRTSLIRMATWDDVRRLALALPETSERTSRDKAQWLVKDKLFVWERPLRQSDLKALGASPATKFVIPTEFTRLIEPFTNYVGRGMGPDAKRGSAE